MSTVSSVGSAPAAAVSSSASLFEPPAKRAKTIDAWHTCIATEILHDLPPDLQATIGQEACAIRLSKWRRVDGSDATSRMLVQMWRGKVAKLPPPNDGLSMDDVEDSDLQPLLWERFAFVADTVRRAVDDNWTRQACAEYLRNGPSQITALRYSVDACFSDETESWKIATALTHWDDASVMTQTHLDLRATLCTEKLFTAILRYRNVQSLSLNLAAHDSAYERQDLHNCLEGMPQLTSLTLVNQPRKNLLPLGLYAKDVSVEAQLAASHALEHAPKLMEVSLQVAGLPAKVPR